MARILPLCSAAGADRIGVKTPEIQDSGSAQARFMPNGRGTRQAEDHLLEGDQSVIDLLRVTRENARDLARGKTFEVSQDDHLPIELIKFL